MPAGNQTKADIKRTKKIAVTTNHPTGNRRKNRKNDKNICETNPIVHNGSPAAKGPALPCPP